MPPNVLRLSRWCPPMLGRDALVARRSAPTAGKMASNASCDELGLTLDETSCDGFSTTVCAGAPRVHSMEVADS
jgi:hypothetical protein